jgi:hypothetical protein
MPFTVVSAVASTYPDAKSPHISISVSPDVQAETLAWLRSAHT